MTHHHLPPDMVFAYKRYKADTDLVVGWLADKAMQLGYKCNTNTMLPKEPKLKGRARKLARDAAKSNPNRPRPQYSCTVKTNEFVEMAKHIVKVHPGTTITDSSQRVWKRTIRVRRSFCSWFSSKSGTDDLTNEQHSHFADVLESTFRIFQPFSKHVETPASGCGNKAEPLSTPAKEFNNMFQHLDVEETVPDEEQEDIREDLVAQAQPSTSTSRAYVDFNHEEKEEEFLFSIWSFMQDVRAVRLYVASTWQLYSLGKVELMQCAGVTNLAVDLIRRAEGDFEAMSQRPQKYPATKYPTGSLPFLIFKLHLPYENGGQPLECDPDTPATMIICGCEICDFLLYMPRAAAMVYVDVLKEEPPTFPTPNNDFRVQVPPFPGSCIFKAEYYHAQNPSQNAQIQLREILPDFSMLSLMLRGGFVEDEILHAARHILENHNVPIWVSFALQIQLDIQRLESFHGVPAFRDLKEAHLSSKARYEEHQKWAKSLGHKIWDDSSEDHLRHVVTEFGEWITGSRCGKTDGKELMTRVAAGEDMTKAIRNSARVPLLERFPVTCGTMKTEIHLEWQLLGLRLVNDTGHVQLLCHLYNALRIINPESPVWPDLELLIRNQGPGKVFVGARPTTLEDAEKRALLSMGMSSANLARNSRRLHLKKENSKKRELAVSLIAKNLFNRWMGGESRKKDEAAFELQQLLFSEKYERELYDDLFVVAMDSKSEPKFMRVFPQAPELVRTLIRLSEGFTAEMPAFMFDYFKLERQCYDFYLKLKEAYRDREGVNDCLSRERKDKTNNPVSTTLSILRSAIEAEVVMSNLRVNKAENRAMGPKMAKHIRSQLVPFKGQEEQKVADEIVKFTREGRAGEWMGKYIDISQNAAAQNIFQPVLETIQQTIKQIKGDGAIRKLREYVKETTFGIFLFRNPSLAAIYGANQQDLWSDFVVPETQVQEALLQTAENPAMHLVSALFLHQEKIMCGTGIDSHAASGASEMDLEGIQEYVKARVADVQVPTQREDWEHCAEIYGKQGRHSIY